VDDEVHLVTVARAVVWLPVCMPVYMPDECRAIAYTAAAGGGRCRLACGVAAVELIMAALCNRGAIIFLPCSFFPSIYLSSSSSSSFFFFLA